MNVTHSPMVCRLQEMTLQEEREKVAQGGMELVVRNGREAQEGGRTRQASNKTSEQVWMRVRKH